MSKQMANDEIVRRLGAAYEVDKLPRASSEAFLAEVRAKAVSVLVFRLAVVLGVVAVIGIGLAGYQLATSSGQAEIPVTDDPGGASIVESQPQ